MDSKIANTSLPLWQRKRHNLTENEAKAIFREGLFDGATLNGYIEQHTNSQPYEACSDPLPSSNCRL